MFHQLAQKSPFPTIRAITPSFLVNINTLKLWPPERLKIAVDQVALLFPSFKRASLALATGGAG